MDGHPFSCGSRVRVRDGSNFPLFREKEEGVVQEYRAEGRNYLVALGEPPRQVLVAQRHLEPCPHAPAVSPPPDGHTSSAVSLAGLDSDAVASGPLEGDVCRICLQAGEEEPLKCFCSCRGAGRWLHEACLRRWQASVLLARNRPEELAAEDRHQRCSVCREEFVGLPPLDRGMLLAGLAEMQAQDIVPGMLLRYAAAYPVPEVDPENEFLLVLFEAKKEHFRHSVYLLSSVVQGAASDDTAAVVGVNLTNSAESRWGAVQPLSELSRGKLCEEDLAAWRKAGLEVSVGLGGPVKPRELGPALLISASEPGGFAVGDPWELRDRGLRLAREGQLPAELRLFLGHAQWSLDQLLGEIVRQSWAVVTGPSAADLHARKRRLWRELEEAGRLRWAPANPVAEEYQSRVRQGEPG